jgi:hypothetical protein
MMDVSPARTWRDRSGFLGLDVPNQPSGCLDPAGREVLRDMAQRTKVAHDLLVAFADRYDAFPVQLIDAQTRELASVRVLLERYGVADPTAGLPAGLFADADVQERYDRLLADGLRDRASALEVSTRLAGDAASALGEALGHLHAPDVRHIYLHLLLAAHQQIRLGQAWSGR